MKRAACTLALQRRRLNQPNSTLGRSGETDSVKKSSGNHAGRRSPHACSSKAAIAARVCGPITPSTMPR